MDKSFYIIVILLSGCWMPSIAIFISNLPAKPHETTVPGAPDVEITPGIVSVRFTMLASTMSQENVTLGSQETTIPEAPDFETTQTPNCTFQQLEPRDVIQEKGKLLIKNNNLTLPINQHYVFDPILNLCFTRSETLNKEIFNKCLKREYNENEFSVFQNGSVKLFGGILEPGSYTIKNGILQTCVEYYYDSDDGGNLSRIDFLSREIDGIIFVQASELILWSIYIEYAGYSFSIIALTVHLVCFCLVPTLRHPHGYNLASLSGTFLLGNLFFLIGQIPQVLGLFCVICAILHVFFYLASFFCMNAIAFDVWRKIRMAANKLAFFSPSNRWRHFIYYSIYSWGTPLLITATLVSMDNTEGTPMSMRPGFGKHDICLMTNYQTKLMFVDAPVIALYIMNGIFFVMCAFLVKKHTLTCTSGELRQTACTYSVLYCRLGILMGIVALPLFASLLGCFVSYTDNVIVWAVIHFLNSLQGFFALLSFSCSNNSNNCLKKCLCSRTEKT